MALIKPYCTLLQLQKEIRNTDADDEPTVLAWHEDCINRASRYVDEYCRRDFWFHDYTTTALSLQKSQLQGNKIFMDWKIISVTELAIDGTAIQTDDYRADAGEIEIVYIGDVPFIAYEENSVTVKGTFGYTITATTAPPDDVTFPESIRRATMLIAAAFSGDNRKEVVGLDGQKVSILDTRIPREAQTLMRRFQRRSF
tara:strand:- start:79 stop:675 length:597 start_codon:yes stop_codon:yes gene_type:complete